MRWWCAVTRVLLTTTTNSWEVLRATKLSCNYRGGCFHRHAESLFGPLRMGANCIASWSGILRPQASS